MKTAMVRGMAACLALALCVGCANMPVTPVQPPPGWIFQEIQAPLTYNFDQTPAVMPRSGSATTRHLVIPFLWLGFSWEDSSIEAAARNGGISEVEYADYTDFNVLGIYREFTVTAYGR